MKRYLIAVALGLCAGLIAAPVASASQEPETLVASPRVITPPSVTGVTEQTLSYTFNQLSDLPPKPAMVSVTLSLSGVPSSGAYALCSATNSVTRADAYLPLSGGPFTVSGLMPSTKYWCFATSSPVGTLDPAAWSSAYEVTTRDPVGITTLSMLSDVYAAFPPAGSYGPVCTWCRDSATNSWRWPMATSWRDGRNTTLPGGLNLPLPLMWAYGLDARLGTAADGTPTIAVKSSIGWVDLVTTADLRSSSTGFTANAFLTANELLLGYLPDLKLKPGQLLGTLELTQEFIPSVPSAPAGLVAKVARNPKGGATLTLSWKAPLDDGGSPITQYRYQTRIGKTVSRWQTTNGLAARLSVKRGATVRIFVVAVNAAGESQPATATART